MENTSDVELVFKSTSTSDHTQRVPLDARVGELKALLSVHHHLHPATNVQRLIFAGRILNDDERLDHVLPSDHYDRSVRHTVHLVLRPLSTTSSTTIPVTPQSSYVGLGAYGSFGGAPGVAGVPFGGAVGPNFVPYPYTGHAAGPMPFVAPARDAAGGAPPARPPAVMAARVIQIDFGLLLKLAFGVYLLSQGGGEQRLAFLIACAIAIYIYTTGIGRRVELDAHGNPVDPPPPQPQLQRAANQPNNNNDNADPNANQNNIDEARNAALNALPFWAREERGGFTSQLAAFWFPLLLSVNPHWHLPDLSPRDVPREVPQQPAVVEDNAPRDQPVQ
jgi:hypothetical protein